MSLETKALLTDFYVSMYCRFLGQSNQGDINTTMATVLAAQRAEWKRVDETTYTAREPRSSEADALDVAVPMLRERDSLREKDREIAGLKGAVVVLRDRVFQSATLANSIAQDEPETRHESAFDCLSNNLAAIRATDGLDPTDRSHEKWELDAESRLAGLRVP